jgi:hypothetical protein
MTFADDNQIDPVLQSLSNALLNVSNVCRSNNQDEAMKTSVLIFNRLFFFHQSHRRVTATASSSVEGVTMCTLYKPVACCGSKPQHCTLFRGKFGPVVYGTDRNTASSVSRSFNSWTHLSVFVDVFVNNKIYSHIFLYLLSSLYQESTRNCRI